MITLKTMPSNKIKYSIQVALMLIVFFLVLFTLIFRIVGEMRSESIRKKALQLEKEKLKIEFIATIEDQYQQIENLFKANEYDKAMAIVKEFKAHGKSDYKDLPKIEKEIRIFKLKQKLDFIPKIHLDEYIQLSKEEKKEKDTSTQVFIRRPRYGQYFFSPSELPILLEGIALSLSGDFSDDIIWKSSIDGELGKGKQLSVRLTIGEHQISATGTNGVTTGTMETLIYIRKDLSKKGK